MNQKSETYNRVLERRLTKLQELFPKWISVGERLPEEGVDVLCYLPSEKSSVVLVRDRLEGDGGGESDCLQWFPVDRGGSCDVDPDVTHWMPLPHSPQKDEATETKGTT